MTMDGDIFIRALAFSDPGDEGFFESHVGVGNAEKFCGGLFYLD